MSLCVLPGIYVFNNFLETFNWDVISIISKYTSRRDYYVLPKTIVLLFEPVLLCTYT
jgi:hypothetical protein